MRRQVIGTGVAIAAIGVTAVCFCISGCEHADGLNGIPVTPESVTLGPGSNTVVFAAEVNDPLALPLSWSVSDPLLGWIVTQSGSNALYRRTSRNGENTVIVRDQNENEGFAAVHQTSASSTGATALVINPAYVTAYGTNDIPFTVTIPSDATHPYPLPLAWRVSHSALGTIIGVTGDSLTATYHPTSAGVNSVIAEDQYGREAVATVNQL